MCTCLTPEAFVPDFAKRYLLLLFQTTTCIFSFCWCTFVKLKIETIKVGTVMCTSDLLSTEIVAHSHLHTE